MNKIKIEISNAKKMELSSENEEPTINCGVVIVECDEHGYGQMIDLIVATLKSNGFVADITLKGE